jgi:glycosyltransferase involved in cell wall biosynthesis
VATALKLSGVPVYPLRVRGKSDVTRFAPLVRLLRAERPAILHAHLFHANLVARLVAPFVGSPHVIATHHAVEQRGRSPRVLIDRVTSPLDSCTVAVSNAAALFAASTSGRRADQIRVIPNGVEFGDAIDRPDAIEARKSLDLPVDQPIVGALGRLDATKGHDDLLRSWRHVLARHPRATLAIAGEGVERSALQSLAERLSITRSVRLLGHCWHVPRFLASLDVFAMPSRTETFGLALLEALAAGLPCVASSVGGLPEVLGDAGVLVPPRSPDLLGPAIARVLDDPARRASLGIAAGERARLFPVSGMIASYEALYDEVLSGTC